MDAETNLYKTKTDENKGKVKFVNCDLQHFEICGDEMNFIK